MAPGAPRGRPMMQEMGPP